MTIVRLFSVIYISNTFILQAEMHKTQKGSIRMHLYMTEMLIVLLECGSSCSASYVCQVKMVLDTYVCSGKSLDMECNTKIWNTFNILLYRFITCQWKISKKGEGLPSYFNNLRFCDWMFTFLIKGNMQVCLPVNAKYN